jgi:hypothetical protein
MKYAKYIDEHTISTCPRKGRSVTNGTVHTNLPRFYDGNPEAAQADGYLPLIEADGPAPQEGYYPRPAYTVADIGVVQGWELIPEQPPELTVEDVALAVAELTQIMLGGE